MSDLHSLSRRPGTFGTGFLVPYADHPDGWEVNTFEHSIVWDPEPRLVRNRISITALQLGLKPCTPYMKLAAERGLPLPDGPEIRFCFEIGPDNDVHPHFDNHPEWLEPESILVIGLLLRLGFQFKPEEDEE